MPMTIVFSWHFLSLSVSQHHTYLSLTPFPQTACLMLVRNKYMSKEVNVMDFNIRVLIMFC